MNNIEDYNKIMRDKNLFNQTIYTTLSEAIKILEERQKDKELVKKIEKLLKNNIPQPLRELDKNGVMFRQVATPNYEMRWFIDLTKSYNLKTIFFEYHSDKFTSNNVYKHSLGQLKLHEDKRNKKGENIEEKITIVNFNKNNGKPLKDITTIWGESLISFHKKLFNMYSYKETDFYFFEASDWFGKNGDKAVDYYTNFLLLFNSHGILFENFILNGDEGKFTESVLLPSFQKAYELTGLRPLIVPIPPMDREIEEDLHWHSHNIKIKSLIKNHV